MNINHLAIIVDGNGRWAKERGLIRSEGHKAGAKNLEKLILYISRNKLANYLSLYVFSTENFARDEKEVNYLMELFLKWFKTVKDKYSKENIKVLFSGNKDLLNREIVDAIKKLEENTKNKIESVLLNSKILSAKIIDEKDYEAAYELLTESVTVVSILEKARSKAGIKF